MTADFDCEVLIIGTGPAGGAAAIELASAGRQVIIADKKHVIGEPVACAGYIPAWITQHIKLDRKCIENKVDFMRTFLPDGTTDDTKTPGFIVNRTLFDQSLVRQAVENGARLFNGMKIIEISKKGATAKYRNKTVTISAQIIIGADGPKSITGRFLGSELGNFIIAKQYEMVLKEPMTHSEVYFHDDYSGGYGWLFPKGRTANCGMGMIREFGLKVPEKLDQFVEMLVDQGRIIPDSNVRTAEGLVPIGGPVESTVKDNIMLAGDAAGMTHPITGAGILNAVITGKEAGLAAEEALKKAKGGKIDPEDLGNYEREWKMFLQSDLALAKNRRELLNGYFLKQHSLFSNIVEAEQKCWVVFKGYYHDDK